MRRFFVLCYFLTGLTGVYAEEKKVALLFLTRSNLNHAELWEEWIDLNKFTVYNHAKFQVTDPWFAQFRIAETQPTSWPHTILAYQALLREALKEPNNVKFAFLTESCVPVRTAEQVYAFLTANNRSYMLWRQPWWGANGPRTLIEFPSECRVGNCAWFILNRKHAQMIADDYYWIYIATRHPIDNESYPSSYLCIKGVLGEVNKVRTTFMDWNRGDGKSPYTFKEATRENIGMLIQAKKSKFCCFARKFAPEFPIEALRLLQAGE